MSNERIAGLQKGLDEARKKNAVTRKLLELIKKDLLLRADIDYDGTQVVDLSDGIWCQLINAINDK